MVTKKAKELQSDMVESAHKVWLAGLGALAVANQEGSKLFKNLVEKGQDVEGKGKEKVEKARGAVTGMKTVVESYWETFEKTVDEKVTGAIHRLGVPTKDEIAKLSKKVEDLTASIEKLRKKEPAAKTTKTA
jgi:poly(hydroxyalkanoate) granule-associated protein